MTAAQDFFPTGSSAGANPLIAWHHLRQVGTRGILSALHVQGVVTDLIFFKWRLVRATGVYREQQQLTWQNVPMAGKKIQAIKAAMLFQLPFKTLNFTRSSSDHLCSWDLGLPPSFDSATAGGMGPDLNWDRWRIWTSMTCSVCLGTPHRPYVVQVWSSLELTETNL